MEAIIVNETEAFVPLRVLVQNTTERIIMIDESKFVPFISNGHLFLVLKGSYGFDGAGCFRNFNQVILIVSFHVLFYIFLKYYILIAEIKLRTWFIREGHC